MLITGAGSQTGISQSTKAICSRSLSQPSTATVTAGLMLFRALSDERRAGYKAEIVDMLVGERDRWFRPADVCVAPDGSFRYRLVCQVSVGTTCKIWNGEIVPHRSA